MHKIKIDIDNKSYDIEHPESFNELTEMQYLEIVRFVLMIKEPLINRSDDQLRLLNAFIGGFDKNKATRKKAFKITDSIVHSEYISDLIELQSFITKEQDFNNWLIPKIEVDNNIFYGPDNRFASMKFGEFIAVDMLVSAYFGSKNPLTILNKIVAVLFREERKDIPKNFMGDRRELLDSDLLSHRENIVKGLDETIKKAILYNYTGIRNWLTKKYSMVFSSPDTSKRMNIALGKKENNWLSIRRHLAGNVITKLKEVDSTNLHDVLSSLNEEMKKTD